MTDDILDGMNRKDMRAWEKVYGAYYAALCSYAAGILRDDEAAKDVVQEVMIKVWTSTQVFATVPDFTAYLYKSVYNNSVCYLRTEANRARILREMPVETVEVPDEHFERMVEEEVLRKVYLHIGELPEDRKRIMELVLKGYSGTEIAEMLGISVNTVKTLKYNAIAALQKELGALVVMIFMWLEV